MKKKLLPALVLAGSLAVPVAASAEGIVGTDVLGLATGAINVYYQGSMGDSNAWRIGGSSYSLSGWGNFTQVFGAYRGYMDDYANGPYWEALGGMVQIGGGSSGTGGTGFYGGGFVGYEATMGDNFVLGGQIGLMIISGGGYSLTGLGLGATVGYKL